MSQENRRVQMTKRMITDAMTELCERGEPVSKISVSELCAIAEVNRSTFYKYYDGPEDLFGEIEEKFFFRTQRFYGTQRQRGYRYGYARDVQLHFAEQAYSSHRYKQ